MTAPTLSYLVCATPRSGSTLLCDLLDQTGVAGHPEEYFEALLHSGLPRRPHEYFDPRPARQHRGAARLPRDARARVGAQRAVAGGDLRPLPGVGLDQGTTSNGVFGAKLMWGYLGDFATLLRGIDGLAGLPVPDLLARVFPDLRYVRITREDKIRQAVSLWRAVQTQAWRHDGAGRDAAAEPVFSFRAINYLVRLLTAHDASWDAYFLGLGIEPLKLTYEELAEAHEPVIRRVLEHIGIDGPGDLGVERPRLKIQADDLSEQWVQRVLDHLEALEGDEVRA